MEEKVTIAILSISQLLMTVETQFKRHFRPYLNVQTINILEKKKKALPHLQKEVKQYKIKGALPHPFFLKTVRKADN